MLDKIHQLAKVQNVILIWVLYIIMAGGVMSMMAKKMEQVAGAVGPIDLVIPTYSVQTVHEMIAAYGVEGRTLYRLIELTVDVIYPCIYGLAFALLIAFLWKGAAVSKPWIRRLPLVAFLAVIFDFLENIAIVTLLSVYPAQPDGVALMAGFFSLMKWSLLVLNLLCIVAGIVFRLMGLGKTTILKPIGQ